MGRQNSTDRVDSGSTEEKLNDKVARDTWDDWLGDMSDREQPEANCQIDDPDCASCGS
jgi:hypothetical protein